MVDALLIVTPNGDSVIVLCCVVRHFVFILHSVVSQSS